MDELRTRSDARTTEIEGDPATHLHVSFVRHHSSADHRRERERSPRQQLPIGCQDTLSLLVVSRVLVFSEVGESLEV